MFGTSIDRYGALYMALSLGYAGCCILKTFTSIEEFQVQEKFSSKQTERSDRIPATVLYEKKKTSKKIVTANFTLTVT